MNLKDKERWELVSLILITVFSEINCKCGVYDLNCGPDEPPQKDYVYNTFTLFASNFSNGTSIVIGTR